MKPRRSFLLSPYRLPTLHSVSLNEEETACWLNGWVALWHPELLRELEALPRVDSSYDHDQPVAGDLFAVPQVPTLFQPDDWPDRVRDAEAFRFDAVPDRQETERGLELGENVPFRAEFRGLGFAYLAVETLFDAMDHEHLLDAEGFLADVKAAAEAACTGDTSSAEERLREAAGKLLSARESLYPTGIKILEHWRPNADGSGWPTVERMANPLPLNILVEGSVLAETPSQTLDRFREYAGLDGRIGIASAGYLDRADVVLPVSSQLWNLRRGREAVKEAFGVETDILARRRSSEQPQTPSYLYATGYRYAVMPPRDTGTMPTHYAAVVNWSGPDGKAIDVIHRDPLFVSKNATWFNIVTTLHQSLSNDSSPTIVFEHLREPAVALTADVLAIQALVPVLGEWVTLPKYFADAMAGEYAGTTNADDFFRDVLDERTLAHRGDSVSAYAVHARLRRRLEAATTYAALARSLNVVVENGEGAAIEDAIETLGTCDQLVELERASAQRLADRLQARAAENVPGYLLLNPCAYTRRVPVELPASDGPIALAEPIKAIEHDASGLRLVVEIPGFGFGWIPRGAMVGGIPKARLKLAENTTVRNEFFEAEIDPATGSLKAFRDLRTRINRLGMLTVYGPGSKMEAKSVTVTHSGAALGEVTAEVLLRANDDLPLADVKLRYRAWLARPLLEVQVTITPIAPPQGYAWHSYYGLRFAWRDDRAAMQRSVGGVSTFTTHDRPLTGDYLEIRTGRPKVEIFTGGLPFFRKEGARMLDLVLIPEGEQTHRFEIGLTMDRDHPMQPAQGFVSPLAVIPTTKGPPAVGTSGWLFHCDAPQLTLLGMKPVEMSDGPGIEATFLETAGFAGTAGLKCVRNPRRATLAYGSSDEGMELALKEDTIEFDFPAQDVVRLRFAF